MNYDQKVVFITGGSTGIGLALANEFAKRGANLLLMARREKVLREAQESVKRVAKSPGQKVETLAIDVSDHAAVKRELSRWIEKLGVPDVLVNCAGFAHPARFEEITHEMFRNTMDVNLGGTWNTLEVVVPHMIKRRSGAILNVSSIAGFIGVYGYTAYGASKFAVNGLSEVLRAELKPHNIRVHVLYPPNTDTPGLAEENKTKPEETKAVEGNAKTRKPEEIAAIAIRGLEKNSFQILAGSDSFIRFMNGVLPGFIHSVTDGGVRKAQRGKAPAKT